ncbi:hypothetical protein KCP75_26200 [Salmonella enterica subsp. enterica]|nr:hypothetical protein KCP75_26200 [Salmonella enterica subsp. enterica]
MTANLYHLTEVMFADGRTERYQPDAAAGRLVKYTTRRADNTLAADGQGGCAGRRMRRGAGRAYEYDAYGRL